MQNDMKAASWALGLWGVLSVIFGVMIVAWPGITLKVFLIILGVYFLSVGVVMFVGSIANRSGHWAKTASVGVISAIAGLYVFANPQISALVALSVIAIWAIVVGMLQLVVGIEGKNDWAMIFGGIVYTLFGFYIFANPAGGAIALVWLVSLSVVIGGIALIVAAFEANNVSKRVTTTTRKA
jgi:uncharacterized membrane protein HdeD (DUF308 family)